MMVACLLSGCATLENGNSWGDKASIRPGWRRISQAAINAVFDLQTLVPAAGAVLFAIDDFDEDVSDWAVRENPVFQSDSTARTFSDWANVALGTEFAVTVFATPSGEVFSQDWFAAKARGLTVEGAAALAAFGVNQGFKGAVSRTRPDGSDDRSFPSGHTSGAFTFSTLANRNLNSIEMPGHLRRLTQIGNLVTASAVGWARVEGEKHFPSDVLASAALGYFLNAFIHDAFLGLPDDRRFGIVVLPTIEGGAMANVSIAF